jgi:BASS family bile acid:Na+ symporter
LELAIRILIGLTMVFVMVIVGLELEVKHFRDLWNKPKVLTAAVLGQLIVLPAAGALTIILLDLQGAMAAGALLIAACPGGGASNVLTAIARGNTALSISLTAISAVLSVLTMPILIWAGFILFQGQDLQVHVPLLPLIGQLIVIVLFPVSLGMWLRQGHKDFVVRAEPRLRRLCTLLVAMLLTASLFLEKDLITSSLKEQPWGGALFTLLAMTGGFISARLAKLPSADQVTFVIEFGVRNFAIVAAVAIALLGKPEYLHFPVTYLFAQALMSFSIVGFYRWRQNRTDGGGDNDSC